MQPIDAGVYKIKAFNTDLYLTVDVFTTTLGNKNDATEASLYHFLFNLAHA